jgi:hypothetical protein
MSGIEELQLPVQLANGVPAVGEKAQDELDVAGPMKKFTCNVAEPPVFRDEVAYIVGVSGIEVLCDACT